MIETLTQLRNKIKHESKFIDVKPYSHNIVGLLLSEIAEKFGKAQANKAIKDFKLDKKGWSLVK